MKQTLYVIACLVAPGVWGLLVARWYNHLSERRRASHPSEEEPTEMYHI